MAPVSGMIKKSKPFATNDGGFVLYINIIDHLEIFTMVTYFFRWTLLKFFSSFPDEQSQQKVRQLDRITAQWLIHQMKLRARYCGNFEFIIFLWEF